MQNLGWSSRSLAQHAAVIPLDPVRAEYESARLAGSMSFGQYVGEKERFAQKQFWRERRSRLPTRAYRLPPIQ